MKRIFLVFCLVLNVTAFAQKGYETDFTQTRVMKVSGKTVEKAGHLVFDGTDHLSMIYSKPEGDFFIIEENLVKINMDGKNVEYDAEKAKAIALQRATLLNCLSGNWQQAAVDNNAELTITEKEGLRTVFIDAKGQQKPPKGGYVAVTLTYNTDNDSLLKMILEQKNGVVNTYELK